MNTLSSRKAETMWAVLPGHMLALSLLFSLISISLTEIFLFLTLVSCALATVRGKERFRAPKLFIPLMIYAWLSLVSAAFSVNPANSFKDCRELALYLIIPMVFMSLISLRQIRRANLAVFASALISMLYSLSYFFFNAAPEERIKGFMGHYMTQAGLLVLFGSLALAMLLFEREKIRFLWGAGFILALPVLVMTMTRNAWIGIIVAACVLVGLLKPKLLVLLPILAALGYFVSPAAVKRRVESIFSSQGYSNRVRLEYVRAGIEIIRDYPLTGTGPDAVEMVFQNPKYGLSEEAKLNRTHLHNNFIQIAAERGIPALLSWLAFVLASILGLIKLLKKRDSASFLPAAAALAALASLVVSGFFEYNFGDSEIIILILYLITVPFSAQRIESKAAS